MVQCRLQAHNHRLLAVVAAGQVWDGCASRAVGSTAACAASQHALPYSAQEHWSATSCSTASPVVDCRQQALPAASQQSSKPSSWPAEQPAGQAAQQPAEQPEDQPVKSSQPEQGSQVAEAADRLGLVQHVGGDLHAAQAVQVCSAAGAAWLLLSRALRAACSRVLRAARTHAASQNASCGITGRGAQQIGCCHQQPHTSPCHGCTGTHPGSTAPAPPWWR